MTSLTVRGTIGSGQTALDTGITDLIVIETGDGATVFATSGSNGGLSSYSLSEAGPTALVDQAYFQPDYSDSVTRQLSVVETPDTIRIVVAGDGTEQIIAYSVAETGQIAGQSLLTGINQSHGRITELSQTEPEMLFLADQALGGVTCYQLDAQGNLVAHMSVSDTEETYAAGVFAMERITVDGAEYLIAACQVENGVTSFRIEPDGLTVVDAAGAQDGIGMMTPVDMEVTTIAGRTYVLIASAPGEGGGQAGAITVMEVGTDGSLVPTDHVMDTLATRFGSVQSLDVVEVDGRVYVIAGGGDDGLTLFVLLPNGRLQMLDVVADDFDITLENVEAVAAARLGDEVRVVAASQSEAGMTELSFDVADQGLTLLAAAMGGTLAGGGLDDILVGGGGNDRLEGRGGTDILEDGAGRDTLFGGNGADVFVLRNDRTVDEIADFEAGIDRIDLSGWPMFYDAQSLTITPTSYGAIVTFRNEELIIRSRDGRSLSAAEVRAAIVRGPDRTVTAADLENRGGDGNDSLSGGGNADTIRAGAGDDTIHGNGGGDFLEAEAGFDLVFGGDGDDSIRGGNEYDTLHGGNGNDTIDGGTGRDLIYLDDGDDVFHDNAQAGILGSDEVFGGAGNDRIFANGGDDTLHGETGADLIHGGEGNDSVQGGTQNDTILGGMGDDTLSGDGGNDVLDGEAGFDLIHGGDDDDSIRGGTEFDTIHAGDGNDTVDGGNGRDLVYLDGGNDLFLDNAQGGAVGLDRVFGGAGNDTILGNGGDDFFDGEAGFDLIHGGLGDDSIRGGSEYDTIHAGAGNDTVDGGTGRDLVYLDDGDDVFHDNAQAGIIGADRVFGGAGNDRIFANGGDDQIDGEAGFDLIHGGAGNDLLSGGTEFDTIHAGAGNDTVDGGNGRDLIYLDDGDDVFHDNAQGGAVGADRIFGGAGNDRIFANGGDDWIEGGTGNDLLQGGSGADEFNFDSLSGHDRITDFDPSVDTIRMAGLVREEMDIVPQADGLLLTWNGGSILLEGLEPGEFWLYQIDFV